MMIQSILGLLIVLVGVAAGWVWLWGKLAPSGTNKTMDTAAAWLSSAILQAEHVAAQSSATAAKGTLTALQAWSVFASPECQAAVKTLLAAVDARLAALEASK